MWGKLICTSKNCNDIPLQEDTIVIGRNNSLMQCKDTRISRNHCQIKKKIIDQQIEYHLIVHKETYVNNLKREEKTETFIFPFDEITLLNPRNNYSISYCFIPIEYYEESGHWNECQLLKNYSIGSFLGCGSFATVRKIIDKLSNETFAVKIVKKETCKRREINFKREVDIFKTLRHPNIIECKDVFEDDKHVFIVMELMKGCDLFHFLYDGEKGIGFLDERKTQKIMKQIFSALHYLHSNGICHRDIKIENVLISPEKFYSNEDNYIKLTDFGLGKQMNESSMTQTIIGKDSYKAPELFTTQMNKEYDPFKCDVWSCGVMMYVILVGDFPFDNQSNKFEFIENEKYYLLSDECIDLLNHIFIIDPKKRYSIDDCLQHEFISRKRSSHYQSFDESESIDSSDFIL